MRRLGWLTSGVVCFMLLALAGLPAAAAPVAEQVLRKALAADSSQTYTGTMVIFTWAAGAGEATAVRVRHQAPGKSRLEYLSARQEPYLVTVDDGIHHWQYRPQERAATLEPSRVQFAGGVEEQLILLKHNYSLQYGGTGEVTGRAADIVELVPRGCGYPAQRLWVDRATGVVLRTEQYQRDGSLVALTVFTAFEPGVRLAAEHFRLKLPKEVRVTTEFGAAVPFAELSAASDLPVRMPDELPEGYVFQGASVSRLEQETVVHLRFTDGLGVISLFQQKARPFTRYRLEGGREVALKNGRAWLHQECGGYVLNWTSGGVNFTLVGEVPPETLLAMASSIPPPPSPGPLGQVRSALVWLFGGKDGNDIP